MDAEAAAKAREGQFRLRCKTKWERRRKAAEVRTVDYGYETDVLPQIRLLYSPSAQ